MSFSFRNLERLREVRVKIPLDEDGMMGRECPVPKCLGYFKVQPGTGLTGENLPMHCPYCGHGGSSNTFFTPEQNKYIESVGMRSVSEAFLKDLKTLEFSRPARGFMGIGISMKVTGRPTPIAHYREKKLETEVVCEACTLRYMIYGVFGYCPDCRVHNSKQILAKNFDLVEKLLGLASEQTGDVAHVLVENALEDCVSSFDGFGRETCLAFAAKALDPAKAEDIRFQNLDGARKRVLEQFNVDFVAQTDAAVLGKLRNSFQKRHLLAHKMGVVDRDYLDVTKDPAAVEGRKIRIDAAEVRTLCRELKILGDRFFDELSNKP